MVNDFGAGAAFLRGWDSGENSAYRRAQLELQRQGMDLRERGYDLQVKADRRQEASAAQDHEWHGQRMEGSRLANDITRHQIGERDLAIRAQDRAFSAFNEGRAAPAEVLDQMFNVGMAAGEGDPNSPPVGQRDQFGVGHLTTYGWDKAYQELEASMRAEGASAREIALVKEYYYDNVQLVRNEHLVKGVRAFGLGHKKIAAREFTLMQRTFGGNRADDDLRGVRFAFRVAPGPDGKEELYAYPVDERTGKIIDKSQPTLVGPDQVKLLTQMVKGQSTEKSRATRIAKGPQDAMSERVKDQIERERTEAIAGKRSTANFSAAATALAQWRRENLVEPNHEKYSNLDTWAETLLGMQRNMMDAGLIDSPANINDVMRGMVPVVEAYNHKDGKKMDAPGQAEKILRSLVKNGDDGPWKLTTGGALLQGTDGQLSVFVPEAHPMYAKMQNYIARLERAIGGGRR